jgi:hypothetical protein
MQTEPDDLVTTLLLLCAKSFDLLGLHMAATNA